MLHMFKNEKLSKYQLIAKHVIGISSAGNWGRSNWDPTAMTRWEMQTFSSDTPVNPGYNHLFHLYLARVRFELLYRLEG